jgi:nucleotide-binding universal stress UspA family protein
MTYKTILVGYDGSENAKRALGKAIKLMSKETKESELRIVVVADTKGRALLQPEDALGEARRNALETGKNLLSDATYLAKHGGIADVYGSVEEGQPADMILALASEYKADLIVVGRRGVRGLQRFLMGSVSSAVIDHATCDVLVVR